MGGQRDGRALSYHHLPIIEIQLIGDRDASAMRSFNLL